MFHYAENPITISMTKIGTVEPVTLKKPCLFHADFNQDFLHNGTPHLRSSYTTKIAISLIRSIGLTTVYVLALIHCDTS